MRPPVQRLVSVVRAGSAAALCALGAHGAAYRSFWPQDGVHGYFGWYEPLVGALSGAALLALAGLLLAAALRIELPARVRCLGGDSPGVVGRASALAACGLTLLVVQETLERSIGAERFFLPGFSVGGWILVLVTLSATAALLALLGRTYDTLRLRVATLSEPAFERALSTQRPRHPRRRPLRRNPIADGRGLRAPPLLTG